MTRAIFQELLLFLLPFAAFAIYLVIARRNPLAWSSWSKHVSWVGIAGLVLVIASLILGGLLAERHTGAFVPSHMENGRVVPGQFK
ncbi:DUF6111 family protein [Microvirga thermotolerans]|uniref:Uncharacterized protein n=1 Tax=Microvirga thermotolerans TaxID=2651334 RepID=A0A5P9JYT1_9HYPH|nr:DUF6111 family protein [Microvirga thermotolerans]QFU17301.1 hypothetical protein GDR74_14320 [Microvirga thermotolerans]